MDLVEIFSHKFIINALVVGLLSSIACGVTGTYVVTKRISYLGGGIAHAVMGGVGIAYFFGINPMLGALVFALISAFIISKVRLKYKQNEDTVISALWAIGMALGLIFAYLTPGYKVNLLTFLFGNILMVSTSSIYLIILLDVFILTFVFLFYKQLNFVCFDEEYASIRGINVDRIYLMLLIMIALTVVILVQSVGLILLIALLTLPSAIANIFSKSISKMIFISIGLIFIFSVGGLAISLFVNLPTGAIIILLAGFSYLSILGIKQFSN